MIQAAGRGRLRVLLRRVLKFQTVGAIGVIVQLTALAFLKSVLGIDYLLATALAVEIAVLHNFCWHERWTWIDRTRESRGIGLLLRRLLGFNLTTGLVSIAANLILMRVLVGVFHLYYLAANVLAIASASAANFLFSELLVFRAQRS